MPNLCLGPRAIVSDGFVVDAATAAAVWQVLPHTTHTHIHSLESREANLFLQLLTISSQFVATKMHTLWKLIKMLSKSRECVLCRDSWADRRNAATVKYVQRIKSSDAIRWKFNSISIRWMQFIFFSHCCVAHNHISFLPIAIWPCWKRTWNRLTWSAILYSIPRPISDSG